MLYLPSLLANVHANKINIFVSNRADQPASLSQTAQTNGLTWYKYSSSHLVLLSLISSLVKSRRRKHDKRFKIYQLFRLQSLWENHEGRQIVVFRTTQEDEMAYVNAEIRLFWNLGVVYFNFLKCSFDDNLANIRCNISILIDSLSGASCNQHEQFASFV